MAMQNSPVEQESKEGDDPSPCPEDEEFQWLEYIYRTAHPVLRWLPTKLAEWIGKNMQEELGFPDKADKRAQPGSGWTHAELNRILQDHVVAGETTFGCVEWHCGSHSFSEG